MTQAKYNKHWEYLELLSKKRFLGSHNIHTPRKLVLEAIQINPKVIKKKNFLVVFNLEFVLGLLELGIDAKQITFVSDHGHKTKFAGQLGVKYFMTNILNTSKRFSCVLMNQPYDEPIPGTNQTKKIWYNYTNIGFDLLEDNGIFVDVSPYSWIQSNDAKLKKIRNRIQESNLTHLKTGVQSYFPTEPGVQIGYFIAENKSYQGSTIYTDNDKPPVSIDFRQGVPIDPKEQERLDLIDKIISSSKTRFNLTLNDKGKNTNGNGQLKVVLNYSKAYYTDKTDDNNMPITTDPINDKQAFIPVLDVNEGEKHKSFLHSKAIIWLANNYKKRGQTGYCDAVKRSVIPQFETNTWTDDLVYKKLGLTQQEVDYIEANS
jgi:hypothetical protein